MVFSIVDAKYRLNARSKLYSANFSTTNFCLTTHYSVNSIGFDQKSTKIIAFYMPIEHPHRIKSDAANSERNFFFVTRTRVQRKIVAINERVGWSVFVVIFSSFFLLRLRLCFVRTVPFDFHVAQCVRELATVSIGARASCLQENNFR